MSDCCSGIIGFSTTESKTLQETPEESYNRRKLGWVSGFQAMEKAKESIIVAALARFFSHFLVMLYRPSCQTVLSFENLVLVQKLLHDGILFGHTNSNSLTKSIIC